MNSLGDRDLQTNLASTINHTTEAVRDLLFLMRAEADDPEKVRHYASLAEAWIVALSGRLQDCRSDSPREI